MTIIIRFFSNIPIKYKILFIAIFPLLIVSWMMVGDIQQSLKEKASMQTMMNASSLSEAANILLDTLQEERDLSAGFLGSRGKGFAQPLKSQHTDVDRAYAGFQQAVRRNISWLQYYPEVHDLTTHFMQDMEQINTVRQDTLLLQSSLTDLFDYYSDMVGDMLHVSTQLRTLYTFGAQYDPTLEKKRSIVPNAHFAGLLSSFILLSRTEEKASLERGILTHAFAQGYFNPDFREKAITFAKSQQPLMTEFLLQSPENINQLVSPDYSASIKEMLPFRQIAHNGAQAQMAKVSAEQWFAVASKHIALLHVAEGKAIDLFQSFSSQGLKQANHQLLVIICGEIIAILIAAGCSSIAAYLLLLGIRRARESAESIAEGDYSVPVPITGNDELGRMLGSIEQMRMALMEAEREQVKQLQATKIRLETLQCTRDDLNKERDFIERLLAAIPSILIGVNHEGNISLWNSVAEKTFTLSAKDVINTPLASVDISWDWEDINRALIESESLYASSLDNVKFKHSDGSDRFLGLTINAVVADGQHNGFLLFGSDVTDRIQLEHQLQLGQKMEAMGELAAGIAHEINTPMQYIGDNVRFLSDGFEDIIKLIANYEAALQAAHQQKISLEQAVASLSEAAEEADIAFIQAEVPLAISQTLEGVEHVGKIVAAMKELSHPGTGEKVYVDINKVIENTVTISRNEWKYVADLELKLDSELPTILALPEINQVFLNMIVNAAHAIDESLVQGCSDKGHIIIHTSTHENAICISISDTGTGITAEQKNKIFDPFYTTKPPGKGTGQGLSISHQIVCGRLGGKIFVHSEPGCGTTFTIQLPILSNC